MTHRTWRVWHEDEWEEHARLEPVDEEFDYPNTPLLVANRRFNEDFPYMITYFVRSPTGQLFKCSRYVEIYESPFVVEEVS